MKISSPFSFFEWSVAWRYLRGSETHFQAKWAPVRVKEMRKMGKGGTP